MSAGKQILDAADIDRMITRITYEILERHKGVDDLALIGIHTRGVFIAKRIQEKIKSIEGEYVDTGEIDITFYRDDWTSIGNHPVVRNTDISFSVDKKK